MGAGSKPLRPWQVCAGDVIGSGKRVEYVFERYGELYINASDEGRSWYDMGKPFGRR